jgi:anti-sigma factor RsiW
MAVHDSDIELLHSYLDGELPVAECEGLWRRLAVERELAGELDHLRADHAVRTLAWSTLEPDDQTVARVESNVMRAARRDDLFSNVHRVGRILLTAAACILFGFTVGWLGRDRYAALQNLANISTATPIQMTSASSQRPVPGAKVPVYVYNGAGQLVATQQFDTVDEAKQFVHDVQAAQASRPAGGDSNVVPAMDRF